VADSCRSNKALAAGAARSSSLLNPPAEAGPLLRLTSGLDGDNPCGTRCVPANTAARRPIGAKGRVNGRGLHLGFHLFKPKHPHPVAH
jgi:hypothetical protein